ncbi:MAG: hypothetical protein A3G76_00550 [Acidobacteria bacterium RIFCSPLOWO2_12_FULL_65_11]|nr:MAG: hypothetical protein A3H95_06915 [Acidobacteria bacterium RIFCSPLOWO2_02_FULL_64_15]OFW34152.1 MAG: hypothetical protein A3G76_00550 [Acidobacteria bacterium RIFCSPLOWO2_12_FULL_65_11]
MIPWPLPFRGVFEWMATLPFSKDLEASAYGFPLLLTAHVLSMCLFLGLIFMMDLRLIGIAHRQTPVSVIQQRLFPWQMLGVTVMNISGFVLFYSQPVYYWGKLFFWVKMLIMVMAGANALIFHLTTYRTVASWDSDPNPPLGAKLAGVLSIVLWIGVLSFGRLIAYDWWTFQTF